MSTPVVQTQGLSTGSINFNPEQIELIKNTIAKGATDDELKLFLHQATRTGLDPLARQIYFMKYTNQKTQKSTVTIITSIDGYRLMAARTGEYAGCEDAVFDNEERPTKATVVVYRIVKGIKAAFPATARWSEYCPPDFKADMWKKMPCTMLAKVAEALALRKAFPAELGGIYTKEEMDQAEAEFHVKPKGRPSEAVDVEVIDPIYKGAQVQKSLLMKHFAKHGIKDAAVMKQLSDEFIGKPMKDLDVLIEVAVIEGRGEANGGLENNRVERGDGLTMDSSHQ